MSNEEGPLVDVFRASDSGRIAIARSILEAAEIPVFVLGESIQDVIGGGRIGGQNIAVGPVHIKVPRDRAEEARELLSELTESG